GDRKLLGELIELFLADCPALVRRIQEAINGQGAAELRQAAHALKGSVANFAAKGAFEAALELENMGRKGQTEGSAEACQRLEAELESLSAALKRLMKREKKKKKGPAAKGSRKKQKT
ncbi:MAG TPA: Hpt domain-containing protein, partial [Sphingomonadales bacterium]|nr:Hpt domain-containing protein [Sphingomonadales bacterium]